VEELFLLSGRFGKIRTQPVETGLPLHDPFLEDRRNGHLHCGIHCTISLAGFRSKDHISRPLGQGPPAANLIATGRKLRLRSMRSFSAHRQFFHAMGAIRQNQLSRYILGNRKLLSSRTSPLYLDDQAKSCQLKVIIFFSYTIHRHENRTPLIELNIPIQQWGTVHRSERISRHPMTCCLVQIPPVLTFELNGITVDHL
jgi:hypothetical protein